MLCLTRKPGQQLIINGNIIIEVSRTCTVRIEAPREIKIIRSEAKKNVKSTKDA